MKYLPKAGKDSVSSWGAPRPRRAGPGFLSSAGRDVSGEGSDRDCDWLLSRAWRNRRLFLRSQKYCEPIKATRITPAARAGVMSRVLESVGIDSSISSAILLSARSGARYG